MTHMLRLTRSLPALAAIAALAGFSHAQNGAPMPRPGVPMVAPNAQPSPNAPVRSMPAPGMNTPAPGNNGVANGIIPEPMAMGAGQYGMSSPYEAYQPNLPNYAWPTYAPYNNYSRVAYPEYYPYDAFPFIGPTHPFPKVPTGWRSVKLEWNDGFWYFSKLGTKHDYWRLRFW
jgi:hypothetical protein